MADRKRVGYGPGGDWKLRKEVVVVMLCLMAAGFPEQVWGRSASSGPALRKSASEQPGVAEFPKWRTTKLGRILVVGHRIRIPRPVVFEIIKAALNRTWSTSARDRNQIVCQFHYPVGSHIQDQAVLFCQTNNEHFQFQERHFFVNVPRRPGVPPTLRGPIGFQEFQTDQMHLVDPSRLRRLLAKLPKANGRYEFEVTKHGHLESEWFMNRGRLVKVIDFMKTPKAGGIHRPQPGK
jgi:hypothetical protein